MFKACLIMKPKFLLCHIPILNSATDTVTLIIMHDIIFTNSQGSICCNIVYEICMAPKADSVAYEYLHLHQHDIYVYVHHGLTAKTAHVTKWQTSDNMVKYIEISTVLSSGKCFHARVCDCALSHV
jgi:hypothetical protein